MHESRKEDDPQREDLIEDDPVWSLLARSPSRSAGPRFVDDVVRRARLDGDGPLPWWSRWQSPVPAWAAAGIAAALVAGFFALRPPVDAPPVINQAALIEEAAEEERLAHLQEVLETEMLFAAVEHLDEFSDTELISLIGF